MHKAMICTSVSLLLACAPSLSDGDGARCSAMLACDEGFSCYRGFCLPESGSALDASPPSAPAAVPAPGADAGATSTPAPAPKPNDDAAARPPATTAPDAGAPPQVDAAVPPAPDAGALLDLDPAALLDALGVPVDCSLIECCREAQRAVERAEKGDEDEEEENSGKCGCGDAQLFSTLLCSVVL
jgi:hypothetical protein